MTITVEQKELFNDGILQATVRRDGLVHLMWLTNDTGRLSKEAVKDLRHIEELIMEDPNLVGWLYGSELEHTEFHRLTEKIGGIVVFRDHRYVWFAKILKEGSYVRRV